MQITVLLFGNEARLTGKNRLVMDVPQNPCTGHALKQNLAICEPKLSDALPRIRLAVNHEFVSDDVVLKATDEVALIGAVGGG